MKYEKQKEYFKMAYNTGSDIWTHFKIKEKGVDLIHRLKKDSLVLDLGFGRAVWAFDLVKRGYRVVGVECISELVKNANNRAKKQKLSNRAHFVEADILNLPFKDDEFDAVTDIGTMQHLHPDNWKQYTKEISRVIKPGGYFLKISLSKECTSFLNFNAKASDNSYMEKFGVCYYFFSEDDIKNIFSKDFELIDQKIKYPIDHKENPVFISALFRKK